MTSTGSILVVVVIILFLSTATSATLVLFIIVVIVIVVIVTITASVTSLTLFFFHHLAFTVLSLASPVLFFLDVLVVTVYLSSLDGTIPIELFEENLNKRKYVDQYFNKIESFIEEK